MWDLMDTDTEMFCVQPIRIYAGVEIARNVFHTVLGEADKYTHGKYQNNKGISQAFCTRISKNKKIFS